MNAYGGSPSALPGGSGWAVSSCADLLPDHTSSREGNRTDFHETASAAKPKRAPSNRCRSR